MSNGARIEGRVLDGAGHPLAEATVMIVDSEKPHRDIALLTDRHGRFCFTDLEPGGYTLAALSPDGKAMQVSTRVPPGGSVAVLLTP